MAKPRCDGAEPAAYGSASEASVNSTTDGSSNQRSTKRSGQRMRNGAQTRRRGLPTGEQDRPFDWTLFLDLPLNQSPAAILKGVAEWAHGMIGPDPCSFARPKRSDDRANRFVLQGARHGRGRAKGEQVLREGGDLPSGVVRVTSMVDLDSNPRRGAVDRIRSLGPTDLDLRGSVAEPIEHGVAARSTDGWICDVRHFATIGDHAWPVP